MKTRDLVIVALLAAIAAVPAYGQANKVNVKVPFSFTLGNKIYPAGNYGFSSREDSVVLEASDHRTLAITLANHVARRSLGEAGQVRFECYGDQCFVSQIWLPGEDQGREVLRSRTETLFATQRPGQYMALLGNTSAK